MDKTVSIIGGGSWGTAIALLLAGKGLNIKLWVFEEELKNEILNKRENTFFLQGIHLPENIYPTNDLKEAVLNSSTVIMASPSHVLRGVITVLKKHLDPKTLILCVTKGIEVDSLKFPSQIIEELLSQELSNRSCYLSGPTFAREVAKKLPTAATIASTDSESAFQIQSLFNTDYFRTYTHSDVPGVELGGALKNVMAIAAGISDGMKNGYNARSSLIARGLAEMVRLGVAMGASPVTFSGLSGMGDLVLTATGDLSRNRSVGLKLGQGKKLKPILSEMKMVAEGVLTTKSTMSLANKLNVDMPIVKAVYSILYEDKSPKETMKNLMTRELKKEFH